MSTSHPSPPPLSAFGGLGGLKATLTDFYQRVYRDPMIGYLFAKQDINRLIEREFEWTARVLGVEIEYEGRPLRVAHGLHPIRRGHFHRRNQLLIESIKAQELPEEVLTWWSAHSASLENAILGRASQDQHCEQTSQEEINKNSSPQELTQGPISLWGNHS